MEKLKLSYSEMNYSNGTYYVEFTFKVNNRDYFWKIYIPAKEVLGFDKKNQIIYVNPEYRDIIIEKLKNHTFNEVNYNAKFNPSKIEL